MKNYFKVTTSGRAPSFFHFDDDSISDTRRAYYAGRYHAKKYGGKLAVFRRPPSSHPWSDVTLIGWETDAIHTAKLREVLRDILTTDPDVESTTTLWDETVRAAAS